MGRHLLAAVLAVALRSAFGQETAPTIAPTPAPTTPWRRDMTITFGQDFYLEQITCPVLSAMVAEGDLVPDEFGYVSRQQVFNAFRRIGISLETAEDTTMGNFGHMPHPQRINIFDMNLPSPARPVRTGNVEHDLSTGIRDGPVPDLVIYEAFEQFIGENDTWFLENIENAIEFFKTQPNDIGSGPGGLEAIEVMFDEFALGKKNNLTGQEMRGIFLEHRYPPDFRSRRNELVRQQEELAAGTINITEADEDLQKPWTYLGCFEDAPELIDAEVPGPDHVNDCAILCRARGSTFFSLTNTDQCSCDAILLSPVSNDQCNRQCFVENGCGARERTSNYRLGSLAAEGPRRTFPIQPDSGFVAIGRPNGPDPLTLIGGAPVARALSSALLVLASVATALSL